MPPGDHIGQCFFFTHREVNMCYVCCRYWMV